MREIAGTRKEFANISWPVNEQETFGLLLQTMISCPIGIPVNLLVLFISFRCSKIDGDYKYFLANLSMCDLLYLLSTLFVSCYHLYHRLLNIPMNAVQCSVETIFGYTAGLCVGFAIPLASINRYFMIVRNAENWFTKKRIIIICLTAYIPFIYPVTIFLFAPYTVAYYRCRYTLYIPFLIEAFFAYVIVIVYPTIMFCNFMIYRVLSKHIQTTTALLNLTPQQIDNEQSILKAIVIQGMLPVVCALPAGVMLITVFLFGWGSSNIMVFEFNAFFVLNLTDLCWCFFMLSPMFDAIIALLIVKQYRAAFLDMKKKLLSRLRCCCSPDNSESSLMFQNRSNQVNFFRSLIPPN
jgi:hypothetical protein